jgi:thymidine kinase
VQAQFFTDLKEFCVAAADRDHKRLLVAGLDGDFRRESFGQARATSSRHAALLPRNCSCVPLTRRAVQVLSLVPHADKVTKKNGRCHRCNSPSLFSLRTVAGAFPATRPMRALACADTGRHADKRTELVGGSEAYQPACRACYNDLHAHAAVAEAAQPAASDAAPKPKTLVAGA